jgi:hypothetical protein
MCCRLIVIKVLFLVAGVLALSATSAFALTIAVDEFGHVTVTGGSSIGAGALALDPISGKTTMAYNLGFATNPGDVQLFEPPTPSQTPSDLIRFTANGQMFFFSDFSTSDPADSPADVGIPALQTNVTSVNEVGAEGNNSASYTPGAAGIGGNATNGVIYSFVSDGTVPEPNSLFLAGLGGGLLLLVRRRT